MSKKRNSKKNVTIDELALMVGRGFSDVKADMNKRFDDIDVRFEKVDKRIDDVEVRLGARIEGLSRRIDDFIDDRVTRQEHLHLAVRVEKLERKQK